MRRITMISPCRTLFIAIFILALSPSCTLHRTNRHPVPSPRIPYSYSSSEQGEEITGRWWEEFGDTHLNLYVEKALSRNYELFEAWARLHQARASLQILRAEKYPELDLFNTESFSTTRRQNSTTTQTTTHLLSPSLSYEVDLWRRIDSRVFAGYYNYRATQEDLESTALVLSGTITDLWLTLLEQKEQERLLKRQIEVNKVFLELVELRFTVGAASALDVFQQRQQLAGTEAEVPRVLSLQRTTFHQLQELTGEPPGGFEYEDIEMELPKLPPFPEIGQPLNLLCCRPDLRAEQRRLTEADYGVAAAIANCYPKLTLDLSYTFSSASFYDILDRQVFSAAADLLTPLFDGGRRHGEVFRRKAIVCENLASYSGAFLGALREVEDALVEEKYQIDLIERLEIQEKLLMDNLIEARSRYTNGLTDYLSVIAAIQSLQNVQRRVISEKRELLAIRARLYRSIGGSCRRFF